MILPTISCAYSALDQLLGPSKLSTQIVHSMHAQRHIEINKSQTYQEFVNVGIPIPSSVCFQSISELIKAGKNWPCVIKLDSAMTLGIQTTVVQNSLDYKNLMLSVKQTQNYQGLVQQFIAGSEHTVTVLVGKHNWIPIGYARDYKKQFDHNQGLNTFGLGSITIPATPTHSIIDAVVDILQCQHQYRGFLSCQFIQDANQKFWLLECNTRLCDPEFQSMAENLDYGLNVALEQCYADQTIDPILIQSTPAVTISLIHQDWPMVQSNQIPLALINNKFRIHYHQGSWDYNTYWGSITNSGTKSHQDLAQEIYDWLDTVNVTPYRYRKDIGK